MEMEIPYTVTAREDTGLTNGKIAIWLFLASEVMLFGALFASLILLRVGAPSWPHGTEFLSVPMATFNTVVLITSSVTMVMSWASLMRKDFGAYRRYMGKSRGPAPLGNHNADVPTLDPGFRRDDERTEKVLSEKIDRLASGTDEGAALEPSSRAVSRQPIAPCSLSLAMSSHE